MNNKRKNPKDYIIYYALEKNSMTVSELAGFYKISKNRVIQLHHNVMYERSKSELEFQKNFVRAAGFNYPVN